MSYYAIGVDLGGTNLRIAAVDESGKLLAKTELETEVALGREHVIEDLCRSIEAMQAKYKGAGELCGIGVGVPGLIDSESGRLLESPNLPGWSNYDVKGDIERRLGTSVILENDANAAALGEQWLGAGRDFESMCMYTLGTGVGGGLVLNGNIWHGWNGMAGELGHCNVEPDGHPCKCGSHGCLEQYASATAVVRMAREALAGGAATQLRTGGELTGRVVYECAMRGDAVAKQVFERVGRALGLAIASMVNALNLPLYVIGGGVSSAWDAFSPALFARGAATLVRLCRDYLGKWYGSGRETAHHADHARHAGRRRRTLRRCTIADDPCGDNKQGVSEGQPSRWTSQLRPLAGGDSIGDSLERVDERAILLRRADADADRSARAPASGERTDHNPTHLQAAAEGTGVLAGLDVEEVGPAFNRRIAQFAQLAGEQCELGGVVAHGFFVMLAVVECGQGSGLADAVDDERGLEARRGS